jgi:hypothetical protein
MIKNEISLLSKKKTRVKKPVKKEIPNRHIANKSRRKDKSGCKLYSQFLNKKYQDDHINYLLSRHSNLNQNQKQEIYHSFSWYDEFVRTGDEYFVPQYITNELLKI